MQTFLPYSSFYRSARCLDYRRLGKQRVEAMQILHTLQGKNQGWKNHPAVLMWEGHEWALGQYMNTCIREWIDRGYKNTMAFYDEPKPENDKPIYPEWLGDLEFHTSHQSNLLRKDLEWYGSFGWDVPDCLPYVWPVRK